MSEYLKEWSQKLDELGDVPRGMVRNVYPGPADFGTKAQPGTVITESAREIEVVREADVVVCGGGPGGYAAAICAARKGAKVVLIERYNYLGGMATGGLVNIFPNLSTVEGEQYIGGFVEELINRLDARGYVFRPNKEDYGNTDPGMVNWYYNLQMPNFYIRRNKEGKDAVLYSAIIEPEIAKQEIMNMAIEAGVDVLLHSWVTAPIMDGKTLKGVVFESKSGRQAVLAKIVIDSTGDGDLVKSTGCDYEDDINANMRIKCLCFGYWVANVDLTEYDEFQRTQPKQLQAMKKLLYADGLYTGFFRNPLQDEESTVWFHPHFPCPDQADVEELTRMDIDGRDKAVRSFEFYKKHVPGFEKSYLVKTGHQLGTTGGRRVKGEYRLCADDVIECKPFEDTIAIFPNNDLHTPGIDYKDIVYVPYRSLIPQDVDNMLVACRAFSSDDIVNNNFNLIPHCMCFGQAAGYAAAIALEKGVDLRDVPYEDLKACLIEGGVILP